MSFKRRFQTPQNTSSRKVTLWLSAVGVTLALLSLAYTTELGLEANLSEEPGFGIWQLLVVLQILVWAGLASRDLWSLLELREVRRNTGSPVVFIGIFYGIATLLLVAASLLGVMGGSILSPAGNLLQLGGMLAVAPALLTLHKIHAVAADSTLLGSGGHSDVSLIRNLRRRVRPAIATGGIVIGLGIITLAQIRQTTSAATEGEPPLVLLYGSFFTGMLFAAYLWVKGGLDSRSLELIEATVGEHDPHNWEEFERAEKHRTALEAAYGMNASARESFEGLVAIAAPLLASLTSVYINT